MHCRVQFWQNPASDGGAGALEETEVMMRTESLSEDDGGGGAEGLSPPTPTTQEFPKAEPRPYSWQWTALDHERLSSEAGRELIRFLMRGMPHPATFGYPGATAGSVAANYVGFVMNFHPFISIFCCHPLHPFTRAARLVVWYCSAVFLFVWSLSEGAAASLYVNTARRLLLETTTPPPRGLDLYFESPWRAGYLAAKIAATVLYAVVVRQIVICPCLYQETIQELLLQEDGGCAGKQSSRRAAKLAEAWMRRKRIGYRVLVAVALAHTVVLGWVLQYVLTTSGVSLLTLLIQWSLIEFIQETSWFVRTSPFFVVLYPIHRAQWFEAHSVSDYVLCRRSLWTYSASANYANRDFARCVWGSSLDFAKASRGGRGHDVRTVKAPRPSRERAPVRMSANSPQRLPFVANLTTQIELAEMRR